MNLLNIYSMMHQPIHPSTHPSIIHISIQLTHTFMHSFLPQAQSCTHLISFVTFLSFIHKHLEFLYSPRFILLFPSSLHWSRFFFFFGPFSPSVLSNSSQSCPLDFSGKNTGVDCHFLLWGIFQTQGLNQHLLCLLHCRQTLYLLRHQGSPVVQLIIAN